MVCCVYAPRYDINPDAGHTCSDMSSTNNLGWVLFLEQTKISEVFKIVSRVDDQRTHGHTTMSPTLLKCEAEFPTLSECIP